MQRKNNMMIHGNDQLNTENISIVFSEKYDGNV